jgi:hypothetical protein
MNIDAPAAARSDYKNIVRFENVQKHFGAFASSKPSFGLQQAQREFAHRIVSFDAAQLGKGFLTVFAHLRHELVRRVKLGIPTDEGTQLRIDPFTVDAMIEIEDKYLEETPLRPKGWAGADIGGAQMKAATDRDADGINPLQRFNARSQGNIGGGKAKSATAAIAANDLTGHHPPITERVGGISDPTVAQIVANSA